ncbi:hypothetical protein SSX86_012002 [Deinandra increscens subsp. villosa]|uniref:RING-type E3 ubiquitin transferase n=1 Tax=Deinandra increscens subsp. villosa TaxID=3103831 RepID=A0AAP0H055_9ASTR
MSSSPPIPRPWQDPEDLDSSRSYALSGRIMLASIIVLFVVVVFLVLLHLYARWYLLRLQLRSASRRRRNRRNRSSSRIVFYVDSNGLSAAAASTGGLDAAVLKSLPLFVYSSEVDVSMPECAVCLSEFEDGETGRVLPKCKHSFHTECIDMWFCSHSNCPLCRSPVEAVETEMSQITMIPVEPERSVIEAGSSELRQTTSFADKTDEARQTTSFAERGKRMDVRIEVPNRNELAAENELNLTSPSQGFWSPGSRLLSFKRIMNMGRRSPAVSPSSGVGPSRAPGVTESDLESAHESSRQETLR